MNSIELASFMVSLFVMIGTVGAAIAAMQSSIIATKALNSQSENNNRAFQPFLVVEGKEYKFEIIEGEPIDKLNWESGNYDLGGSMSKESYLKLVNIHNGVARNVIVNLELEDIYPFINKMQGKNEIEHFEFFVDKHLYKQGTSALFVNGVFTTEFSEIFSNSMHQLDNFAKQKFVYLPNINHGHQNIKIPEAYFALLNIYFNINYFMSNELWPKLKIEILCEDILGKEFSFHYYFKVKSYNHSSSINENDKINLTFEIVEK